MTNILSVKDVTVRFGGIIAVNRVSLDVNRGELVGLLGANGAGKTSLLGAISGAAALSEGRISLLGRSLVGLTAAMRAQRGIALSHQIVRPFRNMSLLSNVVLAAGRSFTRSPLLAVLQSDRVHLADKAMSVLSAVGIAHLAQQSPNTQPLGVLKRLEVARALATDPSLLLLDEPLAGLGHHEAMELADLIRKLNERGMTIILIEHNLAEVLRICPRIAVLNNGSKIADGAAQIVIKQADVVESYLGEGAAHAAS